MQTNLIHEAVNTERTLANFINNGQAAFVEWLDRQDPERAFDYGNGIVNSTRPMCPLATWATEEGHFIGGTIYKDYIDDFYGAKGEDDEEEEEEDEEIALWAEAVQGEWSSEVVYDGGNFYLTAAKALELARVALEAEDFVGC